MTDNDKVLKKINVNDTIYDKRNNGLSNGLKSLLIECLGYIYARDKKICCYLLYNETVDNDCEKFENIHLTNFELVNNIGIQKPEITEKAAICINLSILPLIFNYSQIEVLRRTYGADYYLTDGKTNVVLEAKGTTLRNGCKAQIKKGKQQILTAFEMINVYSINMGYVGTSCFFEQKHCFIKVNKCQKR
ncbi:MAG: hypothetical protein ACXADA_14800 [Candidatus Hodarchaeales archaeon]